jgi:hypothetical protein
MSTDYYILGKISKKEIKSKTDIRIVKSPKNDEFLVDKYGNEIFIKPQMLIGPDGSSDYEDKENIHEFTRYGGNNPLYIVDTLVREFNMAYYSDDGFENLCRQVYDTDIISNVKRDMMSTHKYKFINRDWIMIPKRSENDYKKE